MAERDWVRRSGEQIEAWIRADTERDDEPIHQAMRYSLLAGGKRLRPLLVLASGYVFGEPPERLREPALALEYLHTYSLIHDDLPAMDNDDLRRGKPTAHKVFGEAMAILAGDALLTEAFWHLGQTGHYPPQRILAAVRYLAQAAGSRGLIAGQVDDLAAEHQQPTVEQLQRIHLHKTAELIRAAVQIPAMLMGDGNRAETLGKFGEHFGLMFQAIDDILNVTGNAERMGKATGSDAAMGKTTVTSLLGLKRAKQFAEHHGEEARRTLAALPRAEMLQELLELAMVRQR